MNPITPINNNILPIAPAVFRENALSLQWIIAGLLLAPTVTARLKLSANSSAVISSQQPTVSVEPHPSLPKQWVATIDWVSTLGLPDAGWLEVSLEGEVFAAGTLSVNRRTADGEAWNSFLNVKSVFIAHPENSVQYRNGRLEFFNGVDWLPVPGSAIPVLNNQVPYTVPFIVVSAN